MKPDLVDEVDEEALLAIEPTLDLPSDEVRQVRWRDFREEYNRSNDPLSATSAPADMPAWRCPHCGEALAPDASGYACLNGHRFDRAREGYVNLLPSHHRRSARAGDDGAMVAARRKFLGAGHGPLLSEAADLLGAPATLLDVGCGEGSFTAGAFRRERHGVDILRPPYALRRSATAIFASRSPIRRACPMRTARSKLSRFLRPVLSRVCPGTGAGRSIAARGPGGRASAELRARLFAEARPHRRATLALDGLRVIGEHRVTFDMVLDVEARDALVADTPMEHASTPRRARPSTRIARP